MWVSFSIHPRSKLGIAPRHRSFCLAPMPTAAALRTPIRTALIRGLRRRCPRCGEGRLFARFLKTHERCSECGLLYQRDYGDTLMFMIITDRIPLLAGIAILYFGIHPNGWLSTAVFFGALSVPLLATLRERQGLALALDYLFRLYFRDDSDELHGGRAYVRS
jgi:uncharacterized protein (DUF983 family)